MRTLLGLAMVAAAAGLAGCGGTQMECQESTDDPTASQRCMSHGGSDEAIGTAVAAGATWTVTGCRVNGCNLPYTCNEDSGFCERMACSEGQPCPPPYECDLQDRRCR